MRHDWIFDVLADLRQYAERHGLPATARVAGEAMAVARTEIAPHMTPVVPAVPVERGMRRVSGG